jgi:hypothetical protein
VYFFIFVILFIIEYRGRIFFITLVYL